MEVEGWEVTVLTSESEVVLEWVVEVENSQRFFRPYRWINHPFTCLRVLLEGAVADAKLRIIQNG